MTLRRTADRYVRHGGPIAHIYHGTLAGLEQALKDIELSSRFLPEVVMRLTVITNGQGKVIRLCQGGRFLPVPGSAEDDEEAWE